MLLTPLAVVLGAIVGLLRGGSLRAVLASPVRAWPVLLGGVIIQTLAEQMDVPARLTMFVIGSFLVVVGAMANVHLRGAIVSGMGVTLNLAVVVANGHVPIRLEALIGAGEVPAGTPAERVRLSGLWELETAETNLASLGDIVPLTIMTDVVSFGDLILLGGLFVLTMNLVLHRRRAGVDLDDLLDEPEAVDLRNVIDLEETDAEGVGPSTPIKNAPDDSASV